MSRQRLTVVLSQAQGKNPAKRALEESIAAALIMEPGLDVSIVPYLYDLDPEHTGRLFLELIQGDMVVLSWLYPRAAYWVLDRDGIKELRVDPLYCNVINQRNRLRSHTDQIVHIHCDAIDPDRVVAVY